MRNQTVSFYLWLTSIAFCPHAVHSTIYKEKICSSFNSVTWVTSKKQIQFQSSISWLLFRTEAKEYDQGFWSAFRISHTFYIKYYTGSLCAWLCIVECFIPSWSFACVCCMYVIPTCTFLNVNVDVSTCAAWCAFPWFLFFFKGPLSMQHKANIKNTLLLLPGQ